MVVERSMINSSKIMQGVGTFAMQPEYLRDDEIAYELVIRNEFESGNRRVLSQKLREIIKDEQAGKREVPCTGYSVPSEELQHCDHEIQALRGLLDIVNQDIGTQNRFMSKYIHLEGRVNRIPKNKNTHNITDKVFSLNEKLSELNGAFHAKITGIRKTRAGKQANVEIQNSLSQAMGGTSKSSVTHSNAKQAQQLGKSTTDKQRNNYTKGAIPKQVNAKNLQGNNLDEMYELSNRK